jgi:uncharacterized repeat protein (TIGR01451 family)
VQPYLDTLTAPAEQSYGLRFKIEYRFSTDQARVYYTTDQSNPRGAFGNGSNTTQVLTAAYTCNFTTTTGVVEICAASIPPQPGGTTVRYIVSAWHSSGGPEVFGNSGLCSGCAGFTNSSQATIYEYRVEVPPVISSQPESRTNVAGTEASFSVTATGQPPLSYQWYFKATNTLSAATNSTLTLTNVQMAQAGDYLVVITNPGGSVTSVVATLTVRVPPFISQQPASLVVTQGNLAGFSVLAGGDPPLSYQWRFNDADLTGETNAILTISNAQPTHAGSYRVRVSNNAGEIVSAPASLTVLQPPAITVQPMSRTNIVNSSASFSVNATGTAPLTYQWYFNRTNALPGGGGSTFTLPNVQTNHAGTYLAVVANSAGVATSAVATLTVRVPPLIIQQPNSLTVAQGSNAFFSVVAGGDSPLTYRWRFNKVEIQGATNSTHSITNVQTVHGGNYEVLVGNGSGSVTSAVAVLTVLVPPSITVQPTSLTVTQGQNAIFSVSATGDTPLFYRWTFNGTNIPSATNSLIISNVQLFNAGIYRALVSNQVGSVTSSVATLTVQGLDFGDALDPGYPTLLANNGARHVIVPGLHLGATVDSESDGQPNSSATGDDLNGNDEDGVMFAGPLIAGQIARVPVVASTNGILNAWIDFNRNGSWADPGEQIATNRLLVGGTNTLNLFIPTNAAAGDSFARFRFSSVGGLSFTGGTPDGEVEDYAVNILRPIDVAVTMTDSPDPVLAGNNVTYTLSVTNRGLATATNVMVSDSLPSNMTFVSAASTQGGCTNVGGIVNCALGNLVAGGRVTVTIVARSGVPGTMINTVNATATGFDLDLTNNMASQTTTVIVALPAFTNLEFIDISHPDEVFGPANPYPSTIVVSGVTAMVYKVTATLYNLNHSFPDDLDILLVGPSGRTVLLMSDAGSSVAISDVTLTFDDNAGQTLSNTNQLVSGTFRPSNYGGLPDVFPAPAPPGPYGTTLSVFNGVNPNGTWSLYVFDDLSENVGSIDGWSLNITTSDPISDLAITQSDSPDPTTVGTNVTYFITVTNSGPAVALGTTVTDQLPAGLSLVSVSASVGSCTNQNGSITCDLGNLASGSGATIAVVVTPMLGGVFTNTVTASSSHLDPNPSNNTVIVTTSVTSVTDLAVTKASFPEPVLVGQNLTYTFFVTNHGPNMATGVTLSDTLPDGLIFVSALASQGNCSNANGTVSCALGNIAIQSGVAVTLVCRTTTTGTITNYATATGDQFDDRPANNIAAAVTTIAPTADVSLSMTDFPDPVGPTQNLIYTMLVSNRGPSMATNIRVMNPLPATVNFISAEATSGSCTNNAGTVLCNLTDLASGGSAIVTLRVSPLSFGVVTNQANVTSSPVDTNPDNNSAVALTAVVPVADLAIEMTDFPDPVWRGEDLTYTLVVTNRGPNQANAVRLTNVLFGSANIVSVTTSQGSCTNQSGTITCNLGNIESGLASLVRIIATPTVAGRITNITSVAATEFDSDPASNSHTEITDVIVSAGSFQNAAAVSIPGQGVATPYPSTIVVSGLTAAVQHVRVTLTNLTHTYPDDLDILLVGPDGQGVILMSDAGGDRPISNVRLVFDDGTLAVLPDESDIVSGISRPTDYEPGVDVFPAPAPAGPYGTNLAVFNGINPNGAWSLYILDDTRKDSGLLAGGWRIELATATPIADLSVTMLDLPDPVAVGSNLTYSILISNRGPATASNVTLSNSFPQELDFVSVSASQGNCALQGSSIICSLGTLASETNAIVTIVGVPALAGTVMSSSHVTASQLDLVMSNNVAVALTTIETPPTILVQPESQTPINGESISFSVTAIGTEPLSYQWSRNGVPLAGATNSSLAFNPVTSSDAGDYTVRVDNRVGSVLSDVAQLIVIGPPSISDIADQVINEDTATALIHFTVGDPESPPEALTVTGSSSNPTLVADKNIKFTGSGADRMVIVFPTTNQFGTATITVRVSDPEGGTSADTFLLTVNPVDDPPMIANVLPQMTDEDTPLVLSLLVDDVDTGAEGLILKGTSSNPALVPETNIVFEGTGSVRTAMLTPLPNQFGSATITMTVTDPSNLSASNRFVLVVNSINDPPTLAEISDVTLNEDGGPHTVPLTGIGSGATNEFQTLEVTAVSSAPAIVPNPVVSYTSPLDTGSLELTPLTNANGSATIMVTVYDSQSQNATFTRTFRVSVIPTNDAPTISSIPDQVTSEDERISIPFTIGDAETPLDALQVSGISSNSVVPSTNIVFGGSGANRTLTITPAADQFGTTMITVAVTDANGAAANAMFVLRVNPVNDAPTLSSITNVSILENAGPQTINLTRIGSGATNENDTLTIGATSSNPALIPDPTVHYTNGNTTGSLTFTPTANASGTAIITVTVDDGQTENHSFSRTFMVTVNSRNDPPTISTVTNVSTLEDTPVAIPFRVFDADTAPFLLTVTGVSSNTTLVANTNITFDGNGTNRLVIIRPNAEQSGTTTIRLTVNDGVTNVSTTFGLTVIPVNDRPTLDPIPDITLNQNAPQVNVGFTGVTSGATNENQTLIVTAVSSNTALISIQSVTYSGGTNGSVRLRSGTGIGPAVVAITVDDLGTNGTFTQTFTVFVKPTSNTSSPTISDITDKTTLEDTPTPAIPFIITDTQTPAGGLILNGKSSNQALVLDTNIVFGGSGTNRTVTITPLTNQTGTAIITVSVQDSGFGVSSDTFVLTVNPVNDPPSISSFTNQTIGEGMSTPVIAFTVQDVETLAGNLAVTGSSSNKLLVPDSNITFGGSGTNRALIVTPAPNRTGSSEITVTVSDGATNRSASFFLTVTSAGDAPTISSIADQSTAEDVPTLAIAFTVGDAASTPSNLVVTATSSNQTLVPDGNILLGGVESNRTVTITPATNQFGTTVVTITVADEASNTVSMAFLLTVFAVNDAPTLNAIDNVLLNESAGLQTIELTGISSGATNENQTLALSVSSTDLSLVINPVVNYASPNSNATLTFLPVPGVHGTARINVTVNDGQSQNNLAMRTFEVILNATPTISNIPDQIIPENTSSLPVPFTIGDVEIAPENLILAKTSSNPTLIPNENILIGGMGSNRTVAITPASNQIGNAMIAITVTDNQGASRSNTFEVSVVSTPPIIVGQPQSQTVAPGATVMFQVSVTGSMPFSYQWQYNGIDLPGKTGATLTINDAQPIHTGAYTVVVSNGHGSVTSMAAQLRVLVPPHIEGIARTGATARVSFTTTAGQTYLLEYKNTLDETNWTVLDVVIGTGDILTIIDVTADSPTRFYRLRSPGTTVLVPARITQIVHVGTMVRVSFTTVGGQTYALEYKNRLEETNWTALDAVTGTGDIMTITDPTPDSESRFYRIRSP